MGKWSEKLRMLVAGRAETIDAAERTHDSYVFRATLQLRTPAAVLRQDGRIEPGPRSSLPVLTTAEWQGFWAPNTSPELSFLREGATRATQFGQWPVDDGRLLALLLSIREVYEGRGSPGEKIAAITRICASETTSGAQAFSAAGIIGGADVIVESLFPTVISLIPGLRMPAPIVLARAGFKTIGDLAGASDAELLRLEGLGAVALKRIREFVAAADFDRESERIEVDAEYRARYCGP